MVATLVATLVAAEASRLVLVLLAKVLALLAIAAAWTAEAVLLLGETVVAAAQALTSIGERLSPRSCAKRRP